MIVSNAYFVDFSDGCGFTSLAYWLFFHCLQRSPCMSWLKTDGLIVGARLKLMSHAR